MQRYRTRERPREEPLREQPQFEFPEVVRRQIQRPRPRQNPSFSTMEEWLKEIVVDPSFFMLRPRSDRLLNLLESLEASTVIVPTELYNILSARYEGGRVTEDIEEEEYYSRLLNMVRNWEIPTTVERRGEIFSWISSSHFWTLLLNLFKLHVVPASEYLGAEFRSNPIDIQHIIEVLGETTGRAIISATYGFVRLCRRVKIPTYESYTEWKDNFREKHNFRGNFFLVAALAAGGALEAVLREFLPTPIPEVVSGYVTIKIYDG
jgi:hypothetical protein